MLAPAGSYDNVQRYHLTIEVIPFTEPVLTVNTTPDTDDGTCTTAPCSLREAVGAVNAGPASRILYDIPRTDAGLDGTGSAPGASRLLG